MSRMRGRRKRNKRDKKREGGGGRMKWEREIKKEWR